MSELTIASPASLREWAALMREDGLTGNADKLEDLAGDLERTLAFLERIKRIAKDRYATIEAIARALRERAHDPDQRDELLKEIARLVGGNETLDPPPQIGRALAVERTHQLVSMLSMPGEDTPDQVMQLLLRDYEQCATEGLSIYGRGAHDVAMRLAEANAAYGKNTMQDKDSNVTGVVVLAVGEDMAVALLNHLRPWEQALANAKVGAPREAKDLQ